VQRRVRLQKLTRQRPKRSEHIFYRNHSIKNWRLLPIIALIYSQLHDQCTIKELQLLQAKQFMACKLKNSALLMFWTQWPFERHKKTGRPF
jgi:hypothetical protein